MQFENRSPGQDKFNATYGAAANTILDHLQALYRTRAGVEAQGWYTAEHQNGLVVLIPTSSGDSDNAALSAVDPAETFAVAAMRTYEAYAEESDMDDPEQAELPTLLLKAAQAAHQLAAPV